MKSLPPPPGQSSHSNLPKTGRGVAAPRLYRHGRARPGHDEVGPTELFVLFGKKGGGGSPPSVHHGTTSCGPPRPRAFELKESAERARVGRRSGARDRRRQGFAMRNDSVMRAKCKAASPLGNGFIFAVDFPRVLSLRW